MKRLVWMASMLVWASLACAQTNTTANKPQAEAAESSTGITPETLPTFPGGQQALIEFLRQNVRYPEAAQRDGIQGRVLVQFTVDEKGKIRKPKIFKSVDPSLDAEAMRVVRKLPKFEPGTINGKPTKTLSTLPFTFKLGNSQAQN